MLDHRSFCSIAGGSLGAAPGGAAAGAETCGTGDAVGGAAGAAAEPCGRGAAGAAAGAAAAGSDHTDLVVADRAC